MTLVLGSLKFHAEFYFMNIIKTDLKQLRIDTAKDHMGIVHCRLHGGTTFEKVNFLEAMKEVLDPIDNPRYLLVRQSYLARILRVDYHPVPALIGQNKKHATYYAKKWNRYVGTAKLMYSRNLEEPLRLRNHQ